MEPSSPRDSTTAQVLLGLFVVWQLFFLTAANLLKLADSYRDDLKEQPAPLLEKLLPGWVEKKGHISDAEEVITGLTKRWAQVTGQPQSWGLFSPNVTEYIPFLVVEFRWDEDPNAPAAVARNLAPLAPGGPLEALALAEAVQVSQAPAHAPIFEPSSNEPDNPRSYLRFGKFRVRKFESYLDVYLTKPRSENGGQLDSWRDKIERKVRREHDSIQVYLRWRLRRFQRQHPELPPPRQLVLRQRMYRIPAPEEHRETWMWHEVHVDPPYPTARWQPEVPAPEGYLAIEMYNPVTERFEYLR